MREGLYAIVGAAGIGEAFEAYRVNESVPAAVVMPQNEDEVCALLEYARGMRAPCVVAGSGTHLTHLTPPERTWWLLSTRRLNRVVDYSPQDLVLTVGAGVTLQTAQELLREHNQYLPWNPALPEQATIGGIVASNRAGSWRYRYGTPRDRLLAVRAVRPDGVAFKSGAKVVKSVAGYDLHRLLCGSWGTLAVITEITLKVQPLPATFEAVGWFSRWQELEPTLAALMRMPLQPDGITVVALRQREMPAWSGLREVTRYPAEGSSVGTPGSIRNERPDRGEIPRFARNDMPVGGGTTLSFRAKRGIAYQSALLPSRPNRGALTPLCPHARSLSRGMSEGSRSRNASDIALLSPHRSEGQEVQASATGLIPVVDIPLQERTVQTLPEPETLLKPLAASGQPRPYILLEFSGRPESVAWQIQYLREQGYPAEPVDATLLRQVRAWLAPRQHALMLQILLRPSEVADMMAQWTELPGVSAIAHAGSGVLYIATDESGLTEALVQRMRTLTAKYHVLNGAAWLRQQTGGELPRLTLSEGERRLMQHLKQALDAKSLLPSIV